MVASKSSEENIVIFPKDEYDSLIETLEIQSNLYLMKKINAGQQEVENGNVEKIGTLDDLDNWIKKLLAITIEDKDRTFNLPILSAKYPAGSNPSMIPIF